MIVEIYAYKGSVSDGNFEDMFLALLEVDAHNFIFIVIPLPITFKAVQYMLLVQDVY